MCWLFSTGGCLPPDAGADTDAGAMLESGGAVCGTRDSRFCVFPILCARVFALEGAESGARALRHRCPCWFGGASAYALGLCVRLVRYLAWNVLLPPQY